MASGKPIERTFQGELLTILSQLVQGEVYPFEVRQEVKYDRYTPDLSIYPKGRAQPFAIWELKPPGQEEDLARLPKAATIAGVSYALTSNVQETVLYRVQRGRLEHLKTIKGIAVPDLNTLYFTPEQIEKLRRHAEEVLKELKLLLHKASEAPLILDKIYFISKLREAITQLSPHLKKALEGMDTSQRSGIEQWAAKQGYLLGDAQFWERLAQHWAYALAVRILFYFAIRPHFPGIPLLQSEGVSSVRRLLQEAFKKAQEIDWQAVFEESPLDKVGLPEAVEEPLRALLRDLNQRDFSRLREDVIGQIMEGLIPRVERHALGQYFTREDVVDFILGFVVKNPQEGAYLDPTCGSGVFLTRLYYYLRFLSGYRLSHEELLQRIWGIDIAHFPAQLATINLFRQSPANFEEPPRIQVRDFFDLQPGVMLSLKRPKPIQTYDSSPSDTLPVSLPVFRGIVGNFPYIRQELIERKERGYKKRLVQAIAENWLWKDPELFKLRFQHKSPEGLKAELKRTAALPPEKRRLLIQEWIQENRLDLKLSGQADIYAYLFYHAAAFLEEGGRMGILTSNAWLDVAYGQHLKEFFLRHFKIIAIVGSWVEPWFEEAQVNTVFTILEWCSAEEKRRHNLVRFVKLKKKLSDILPQDLQLEEAERFRKIMALVRQIEKAEHEYYRRNPTFPIEAPIQDIISVEYEEMRVRLVPQA
ncbi:MAG: SAM-dependent methyltransferase, partial [Bacteroidia bacterium]|nr:SAM-dependent methyltransferase [Bacteroidia bacterium]